MTPGALLDVEANSQLITIVEETPGRICEITEFSRPEFCRREDEHAADLEVLFTCGCVVGYCDNGWRHVSEALNWERFKDQGRQFACGVCKIYMNVVAIERLKK